MNNNTFMIDQSLGSLWNGTNPRECIPMPNTGHHQSSTVLLLTGLYTLVCIFGVIGNSWVVRIVGSVLFYGRADNVPRSVQVYILSLCCVNMSVIASLLFIVCDLWNRGWMFGWFLCRMFQFIEGLFKFGCPYVLAALSGTCYASICMHNDKRQIMISMHTTIAVVAIIISGATLLSMPQAVFAKLVLIPIDNVSHCVAKCIVDIPLHNIHTATLFLITYVVPLIIFCYFYFRVWRFVHAHSQTSRKRSHVHGVNVTRVRKTVFGLVFVYVLCWTTYWLINWVATMLTGMPPWMIMLQIFGHVLPYMSVVANPVIYTRLNRGIQHEHARLTAVRRAKTTNDFANGQIGAQEDDKLLVRLTSFRHRNKPHNNAKGQILRFNEVSLDRAVTAPKCMQSLTNNSDSTSALMTETPPIANGRTGSGRLKPETRQLIRDQFQLLRDQNLDEISIEKKPSIQNSMIRQANSSSSSGSEETRL